LVKDLRKIIFRISQDRGKPEKAPQQPTIFHEILQSDLPEDEKSMRRLGDEAQLVIGAGLTTTAWALSNAMFYIVDNPSIQETLRAELREAFPDPKALDALSLQQLEKLPYLRACIREGIRLSHGVSARNPRIMDTPITYSKWTIPAATPVSMTIGDVHFDEAIYPKPKQFLPERWLNNPKAPDGSSLDHYFVAFGKGPRLCLGIKYVSLSIDLLKL
jgi:cytochrome P450